VVIRVQGQIYLCFTFSPSVRGKDLFFIWGSKQVPSLKLLANNVRLVCRECTRRPDKSRLCSETSCARLVSGMSWVTSKWSLPGNRSGRQIYTQNCGWIPCRPVQITM
jgi:predicted metal-binding protein